tara:strand:+ start:270 stop:566 length:297 start_codon:yes stop_codon:yes gene_type:complete
MNTITLPVLSTEKEIKNLHFPNDLRVGMYIWDPNKKVPILITSLSFMDMIKETQSPTTRFATKREVLEYRENQKYPHVMYNTITKLRAYNYAAVIYNY